MQVGKHLNSKWIFNDLIFSWESFNRAKLSMLLTKDKLRVSDFWHHKCKKRSSSDIFFNGFPLQRLQVLKFSKSRHTAMTEEKRWEGHAALSISF
jgi:hypothetical protein